MMAEFGIDTPKSIERAILCECRGMSNSDVLGKGSNLGAKVFKGQLRSGARSGSHRAASRRLRLPPSGRHPGVGSLSRHLNST